MTPAIAMIPLLDRVQLSTSFICSDFTAKWPSLPKPKPEPARKDQWAFHVGDTFAVIALIPAAIPWADLEGPCATSVLWKDAARVLRPHAAHLIVTVLDQGDDIVRRMGMLTRVCASVLATCDQAPGVYWGAATMVIPSEMFQEFAKSVLPQGPPLPIWVDVRVGTNEKGGSSGFTTGMKALGHLEFETENATETPEQLWNRLHNLAEYVITHGPVLQDGHTVGADETEKIRVVRGPSSFGHEGDVLRLDYAPPKPKSSWWGRKS